MTTDAIDCSVYRSPKKDAMYLYVPNKDDPFKEVPEDLLAQFGSPGHVMDLKLTAERQLARVDTREVLRCLHEQGYFLQMPPSETVWK